MHWAICFYLCSKQRYRISVDIIRFVYQSSKGHTSKSSQSYSIALSYIPWKNGHTRECPTYNLISVTLNPKPLRYLTVPLHQLQSCGTSKPEITSKFFVARTTWPLFLKQNSWWGFLLATKDCILSETKVSPGLFGKLTVFYRNDDSVFQVIQ